MCTWALRPLFSAALYRDDPASSSALDALTVPLFSATVAFLRTVAPSIPAVLDLPDHMTALWVSLVSRPDCPSALLDTARILHAPQPAAPAAVGDNVLADTSGIVYTLVELAPLATLRSLEGVNFPFVPPSALWFVAPTRRASQRPISAQVRSSSQESFLEALHILKDVAGYLQAQVDPDLALQLFKVPVSQGWRSIALLSYASARSSQRIRLVYRLSVHQLAYEDAVIPVAALQALFPEIRAGPAGLAPLTDFATSAAPLPASPVVPEGPVLSLDFSLPTDDDDPLLVALLQPAPLSPDDTSPAAPFLPAPLVQCTCGRVRGVQGRHTNFCDISRTRVVARALRLYNPTVDPTTTPILAPHPMPPADEPIPLPSLSSIAATKFRLLSRVPLEARPAWADTLRQVFVQLSIH
jgi:hypothetical protein